MIILARGSGERVLDLHLDAASLPVDPMDGRIISGPLAWFSRLSRTNPGQRAACKKVGGYGIHWSEIDEDLSTKGLLRAAPAPRAA